MPTLPILQHRFSKSWIGLFVCLTGLLGSAKLSAKPSEPLTVFAAASLVDVLPQIAERWQARGEMPLRFSFDASSRLARQIEAGAPADVYISANDDWMKYLIERQRVSTAPLTLTSNALVLAVPKNSVVNHDFSQPQHWRDLPRLALAGEQVPAGSYAHAALDSEGLWPQLRPKIVRGHSVRTVLNWLRQGEVPAGIVYLSDVMAVPDQVRIARRMAATSHPPIHYRAAVIAGSAQGKLAQRFLKFCQSVAAQELLTAAGFVRVEAP